MLNPRRSLTPGIHTPKLAELIIVGMPSWCPGTPPPPLPGPSYPVIWHPSMTAFISPMSKFKTIIFMHTFFYLLCKTCNVHYYQIRGADTVLYTCDNCSKDYRKLDKKTGDII